MPVVEIMDTDGECLDSVVGISHRPAGREMAAQIVRHGYGRIGFLGTKMPMDHRARKRFEGFTEALAKQGIEVAVQEFCEGGSSLSKGRELTEPILARCPDLDFIYYSNDMIGAGGLLHLLDKRVDVPGQIGLAGFNGSEFLDGIGIKLATMDSARRKTGRTAAEIVLERNKRSGATGPCRVGLTPQVQFGDTLRRRRAG